MSCYYGQNVLRFTAVLRICPFQGKRNIFWFNNLQPARKIALSSSRYEQKSSKREPGQKSVLLVDELGCNQGEMSFGEAMRIAKEKSLELVWVDKKDETAMPVYKIMSQRHKLKLTNKSPNLKTKTVEVTEKIEFHDLYFKVKRIEGYLEKGHQVKFCVRSKYGRNTESTSGDKLNIIKQVKQEMQGNYTVERPVEEGEDRISCIFKPS